MRSASIRIRAAFQPDNEESIALLRILGASNDLNTLSRLLLDAKDDDAIHAKRRYMVRMSVLHIFEIKDVVMGREFKNMVERYSAKGHGLEALGEISSRLKEAIKKAHVVEILAYTRNSLSGHYSEAELKKALSMTSDSELMEISMRGSRVNVSDRLFDILLASKSHGRYNRATIEESFKAVLNDILDIHHALVRVVEGLVAGLYLEARGL